MARVLGVLVLLLVAACRAPAEWRIEAPEAHAAEFIRVTLLRVEPAVIQRLNVSPRTPGIINLSPQVIPGAGTAYTWQQGIFLGREAVIGLAGTLGHELVHWHIAGTVWELLPPPVIEGLAYLIGQEQVASADRCDVVPELLLEAATVRRSQWDAMSLPERDTYYAGGEWIARRHGVEGLRSLCISAQARGLDQVPADELVSTFRESE